MKNCCSAFSQSHNWRTSSSWRTAARRFQRVTYKLLVKSYRLSFSNGAYNVQVAHEELPLAVFQRITQKEIAMILAENEIFIKEVPESILPEEIIYFNVQNKCTNRLGHKFTGENQWDSLCKRQHLHPGITRETIKQDSTQWDNNSIGEFILSRNGQGKLNQKNHPRGLAQSGN